MTKSILVIKQESFMDIHTIRPFHIPELVSFSQMMVY